MDWANAARELDQYLRLKTFPLAFKLFASVDALEKVKGIRRLDYKPRLCQLITMARVHGWARRSAPLLSGLPSLPGSL
jgi:uncharacterized protein (DUF169 family)